MIRKNVILNNDIGLHARPAALFVQTANKFVSDVDIELKGKKVNGKSIIGVMSLGAFNGEEITLIVKGIDEEETIEELAELLEHGLKDI